MAQIFISYSKHNIDFARHLRDMLQQAGFEVWMDEIRLATSQHWAQTLETSITGCTIFMIILSPESKTSQWVARELLLAERLNKPVFPILYSGDVWWNLANIQYEDMRDGVKAKLSERLVESLNAVLSGRVKLDSTPPVLPPTQTDSRRLEAAMPAETKSATETEVWAKISLPASEGLRGELPAVVPSGDVIQKDDARATSFPIQFPVDPQSGRRLPAQAELRVLSGDFAIVAPGETAAVEIPPDTDSRTVIFTLEPKPGGKTSGRSRVFIDLIYEMKIVAQISVSTQLVERVTAAVPTWNLMAAYAAPQAAADTSGELMRGIQGMPLALPEEELLDLDDDAFADEFPGHEESLAEFHPELDDESQADTLDDLLTHPAPQPFAPTGQSPSAPVTARRADRARRRRSSSVALLRFASASAAILLVFVIVVLIGRNAAGVPGDLSATQQSLDHTQAALLGTEMPITVATVNAVDAIGEIAVAPFVNCAGTPGDALVALLREAGFDVALLDTGITDQAVARATPNSHVVVWGACSGDALWLYVELLNALGREGLTAPPTITLIIPVDAVERADSYATRLVGAVAQYARGDTGAELAQTFADLAATAMDEEDAVALQTLQQNVENSAPS